MPPHHRKYGICAIRLTILTRRSELVCDCSLVPNEVVSIHHQYLTGADPPSYKLFPLHQLEHTLLEYLYCLTNVCMCTSAQASRILRSDTGLCIDLCIVTSSDIAYDSMEIPTACSIRCLKMGSTNLTCGS